MMNPQDKRTVSVEDLLRVKRAERPPPEFWVRFDQELRAKQLAALVEKRPWWRSLPLTLRGLARYHLPLGASAVLAVTLLTIRDYEPITPGQQVEVADLGAAVSEPDTFVAPVVVRPEMIAEAIEQDEAPAVAQAPVLTSEASVPGELARMVPMLPATETNGADLLPSARSIAENRAVAEAMLGTTNSGFETRALPVRVQPQEPLAQMSNPSERRRSRFANAFAAAAVGTSPIPTARVARRLSDEQLYDTINRFGASGNSVSIKF